jgi:hypothetical protein
MIRTISRAALVLGAVALGLALFGIGPSIARIWSQLHANSLVGLQGFVDRTLDPDPGNPTVWFDQVLPILAGSVFYPVAVVLGIIGLVTLMTSRS